MTDEIAAHCRAPLLHLLALSIVAPSALAKSDWTFSVGVDFLTLRTEEIVLKADGGQLSKLSWDADHVPLLSGKLSYRATDWLELIVAYQGLVQDGDGTMDDYDWLLPNANWSDWSHHPDTRLSESNRLDLSAEVRLLSRARFSLFGVLGYRADRIAWEASGGSYIYSEAAFRDSAGTFLDGITGIRYEQRFESAYLGGRVQWDWQDWSLSGRVLWAPSVQFDAEDTHHWRELRFDDSFDDTSMTEASIALTYYFDRQDPGLSITASASWMALDDADGETVLSDLVTGQRVESTATTAKASSRSSAFGLAVSWYF